MRRGGDYARHSQGLTKGPRHIPPLANLKPAKDKSTERIDGIVALIMAIGRAMLPQEPVPSYSMIILG